MGKDMIIKLLESQLEVSNATISQLRLTVDTLNNTISDLRATIVNLESLLTERDKSLDKANNQVRGMSKLLEKKSEKQSSVPVVPKSEEEIAQKEAERKVRGNNGAKRTCTSRWRLSSMMCILTVWKVGHRSAQERLSAMR